MENSDQNIKASITETIQKIAGFMEMECQIDIRDETDDKNNKTLLVSIYTPENARFLIGKDGQNLKSLEHVLRAIFLKRIADTHNNIVVDVNDYRKSRSVQLIGRPRQAVTRVRSSQKAESLLPMSSYE